MRRKKNIFSKVHTVRCEFADSSRDPVSDSVSLGARGETAYSSCNAFCRAVE